MYVPFFFAMIFAGGNRLCARGKFCVIERTDTFLLCGQ